jgi:uncharacterized protein
MRKLVISEIAGDYAVCRGAADAKIDPKLLAAAFTSITRTAEELSIICPTNVAPPGFRQEPGWQLLKIEGPFEFSEIGILASVAVPLAQAKLAVLVISTFDTDYLMVKRDDLAKVKAELQSAGHHLR